jgi:hypothetical protein
LLNEAGRGESAVRKLEEMDNQLGMNNDPSQTNAARNQAKMTAELNEGPSVHYDAEPAAQPDMNQMMMQMMQTMQSMQKEIANLKGGDAPKKVAAKKTKTTAN